jgi:glutamate 5-kinase
MKHMDTIIVKIGTRLITKPDGQLNREVLSHLLEEVAELKKAGKKVVIVSSGAVGAGRVSDQLRGSFSVDRGHSGGSGGDNVMREQVLAAIGQPELMTFYVSELKKHNINCAQLLVTRAVFDDRQKYVSLRTVSKNLLQLDIVPIFNENDVLSDEELDFSDNDHLACMVTAMLVANQLIVLTNVPGVYDPKSKETEASLLPKIEDIQGILPAISKQTDKLGRGGMHSKLLAAAFITALGIPMHIASGFESHSLSRIVLKGEKVGTFFPATGEKMKSKKVWLTMTSGGKGKIVLSTYLAEVLRQKQFASILLAGIESVEGTFAKDDVITVYDVDGVELGKGQSRYDSNELKKEIEAYRQSPESKERVAGGKKIVIHYDHFAFSS